MERGGNVEALKTNNKPCGDVKFVKSCGQNVSFASLFVSFTLKATKSKLKVSITVNWKKLGYLVTLWSKNLEKKLRIA